jgi:hypothetical protein
MGFSCKTISPSIIRILFLAAVFYFICLGGIRSASTSSEAMASSSRLVGTVQGAPFSGAVFDDGTGVQTFYRLHEQLPDGSYIVKVRNDSILIKKADGGLYEMFTTGTATSEATAVPSSNISPAEPQPSTPYSGTSPIRSRGRFGRAPQPDE